MSLLERLETSEKRTVKSGRLVVLCVVLAIELEDYEAQHRR